MMYAAWDSDAVLDKSVWHYYDADYYCFTDYSNDILHYYDLCC